MSKEHRRRIPLSRLFPYRSYEPFETDDTRARNVILDIDRFYRFANLLLVRKLGEEFFKGTNKWIVDIAAGNCQPGIGLCLYFQDKGFNVGYFGCDISNYLGVPADPIKVVKKIGFGTDDLGRKIKSVLAKQKIKRSFGDDWDAKKSDIWTNIENEIGGIPALLMMRHPEIRRTREPFQIILDNIIKYCIENRLPLWLTARWDESINILYEMLPQSFIKAGFNAIPHQQPSGNIYTAYVNETTTNVWNFGEYDASGCSRRVENDELSDRRGRFDSRSILVLYNELIEKPFY